MNLPRLIRPADLEKVGQDRRALVTLTNKGELTRLRRGVYVKSTEWTELNLPQKYGIKTLAYQQQTMRQPVFAHATAGLLWGLWLVRTPQKLHVITDVTTSGRSKNGVVRHRGSMTKGLVSCGPFLLTDKITTVMQLILSLDFPSAVAICDSSLRVPNRNYMLNHFAPAGSESNFTEPTWQSTDPQGLPLQLVDLVNAAELLPTKAAQRRALAIINFSSPLSGSAGESISRAKMHQWGFPAPVLQKHFTLRDGSNAFVDFWFEEQKIVGEFDGKGKYLRRDWGGGLSIQQRVVKEKQRENQIRAQGLGFARWDWKEMMNRERFIYLLHEAGLRQN